MLSLGKFLRQFYLIVIELHPGVRGIEWSDFFYPVFFVVIEDFHIRIFEQVKIDFIAIIPNSHHKGAFLVKQLDPFRDGIIKK